jgi:exopolysaccharide biosynthesis polyprenyl glycosylphosphotransferase
MSQAPVTFPSLFSAERSSARFSWKYASRHFDDLGTVRVGLYGFVRDLIPSLIIVGWWLLQRPISFSTFSKISLTPQLSLLDVTLLGALTLCWREIAGSAMASGSNLFRKQTIGNLIAASCCSILVFFAGCAHTTMVHSLILSGYFFIASASTSLLWLAAACISRWAALRYVVAKREVILVGSGRRAQDIFTQLMEAPTHMVTGIVDEEFTGTAEMRSKYLGGIDELERILREHPVAVVYCALPVKTMYVETQRVISVCEQIGVEVRHPARLFNTDIAQMDAHSSAHGMFAILRMVRKGSRNYFKRIIDIIGASALLIVSAPILILAAIAIKISSPGPILFAQERYGLDRRRFRIYKLRTMVEDAEVLQATYESMNELAGPVFKIRRDPRITPVGGFLRTTSIDELPQLWNVLKGDMSLVGPRPLAVRDVRLIQDSRHLRRFSVKPGITCTWQISGRNATDFETWIRQDLDYIDNWSLYRDFRILVGTVPAVLWRKGAM